MATKSDVEEENKKIALEKEDIVIREKWRNAVYKIARSLG